MTCFPASPRTDPFAGSKRIAALLAGFLLVTGCRTVAPVDRLDRLGIAFREIRLDEPRPNQVRVLEVDLARGRVHPEVLMPPDPDGDGPAETSLRDPFSLVAARPVVAFVNTNPWEGLPDSTGTIQRRWTEGQPVDVLGLVVTNGEVRSEARSNRSSVWFDARGRLHMGDESPGEVVRQGLGGFQQILVEDSVAVPDGGAVHPRTAIGADAEGRRMWLVVVDGRQEGFSEGMSLYELAVLLRGLGCRNAMNLDGGGSSIMALKRGDHLEVVSSPSDRAEGRVRIRPIPTVLALRTPG